MKKNLMIILCTIVLFITGCTNTNNEISSTIEGSSQTESNNSQEEIFELSDYFSVDIKDNTLDKFNAINNDYSFEQYINDNITLITIDDYQYNIKKTKFSDVIENLKKYTTDENSLKYLNNTEQTIEDGKFIIKANISNAIYFVARFNTLDNTQSIKDYTLNSFTVNYNVYESKIGDKLVDNFECVLPFTLKENIWTSKISDKIKQDNSGANSYYSYHNPVGIITDELIIKGFTIQASFDRADGYLIHFSYEVNS